MPEIWDLWAKPSDALPFPRGCGYHRAVEGLVMDGAKTMPSEPRRHGRYVILLVGLLLMVVVRPLVLGNYLAGLAIEGAAALLLLIFVASMRRRVLGLAAILLVGALASGYAVAATWDTAAAHVDLR